MESKPIGKRWEPHRHVVLHRQEGTQLVVMHVQLPAAIGVRVGQAIVHAGEPWLVAIRYDTPWNKCMDV